MNFQTKTELQKEKKQTENFSFHEHALDIFWKEKFAILQIKLDIWEIFVLFSDVFGRGDKNKKLGNGLKLSLLLWIIFLQVRFKFMCEQNFCIILLKKKKIMAPFYGWGSTVSRLHSLYKETVYFLLLCPQELQVLI